MHMSSAFQWGQNPRPTRETRGEGKEMNGILRPRAGENLNIVLQSNGEL